MISFCCQHCGQNVRAKEIYAGKEIHCPKCRQTIRIPPPDAKNVEGPMSPPFKTKSDLIKIRCPGCRQKIGLDKTYIGKTVKCAKCGKLMTVPSPAVKEASPQPGKPDDIDHDLDFDALLSQQQIQTPAEEQANTSESQGIELLRDEPLQLASAPEEVKAVPKIKCPKCGELNPPDAGICMTCAFEFSPGAGARAGKSYGAINIKREITIGIICLLITAAMTGFVIVSIIPGLKELNLTQGPRIDEARQISKSYIDNIKAGDIAAVKKLLIPGLRESVTNEQIEQMRTLLDKTKIADFNTGMSNYEADATGDRYYLSYNLQYERTFRPLILSLQEVDNELKIDGAAINDLSGPSAVIGSRQIDELTRNVTAPVMDIFHVFMKSCCAIVVFIAILGMIVTISMWVVFNKAGQPGWAVLVPFYNMWVLAEVGDRPGWVGLASYLASPIPYIGFLIQLGLLIYIYIGVAKAFERSILFGLGLVFLPIVFYPVLAFGSD